MSICFLQVKQIMVDQKDIYLNNPIIVRHYPLEENINYCFVGIRRTGKSYMMYQQNAQQRNCFYTGRPFCHHEYPYSFSEYLTANGKEKNYLDTISTSDNAHAR